MVHAPFANNFINLTLYISNLHLDLTLDQLQSNLHLDYDTHI